MQLFSKLALSIVLFTISTLSHAGLIGDVLTIDYGNGSTVVESNTESVVAGTGDLMVFENGFSFPHWEVNAEDDRIIFEYVAFSTGYGGSIWTISGISDVLSSVVLDNIVAQSNFTGLDQSDISIVGNDIQMNFAGFSLSGTGSKFELLINPGAVGVSEPSVFALLLMGLLGFGVLRRRA